MASLPADPAGLELEDFVAAHLAARGMFVERGVTERNPRDILELDIVWTDYGVALPRRRPVEIKSGGWGLGDLFKFNGWVHYLGLEGGSFIYRHLSDELSGPLVAGVAQRAGIQAIHLSDIAAADAALQPLGLAAAVDPELLRTWRYSVWAQRRLVLALAAAIRARTCPEVAKKAKEFFKLINDATFFEPDVRTRVDMLFNAHMGHRLLAASAAAETARLGVNFDTPASTPVFTEALYNGAHFPVQACLLLGHRGRLAVLKAAVDYVIARQAGQLPEKTINVLGLQVDLGLSELYAGFRQAVDQIEKCPSFRRYPVFWQTFLWAWGGFIMEDMKQQEYAMLSQHTGVPTDEIDSALRVFDLLFPTSGGWFTVPAGSSRRLLKLMPAAMRGIGADYRLHLNKAANFDVFGAGSPNWRHLGSDNNAAARLLDGDEELIK